mmetsp:Transcript_13796/g.34477  ORF Transcript_13796/g.34477 Transcript_13796/m.34477 type:complete len:339 (+) Transcript_13796:172-1188(+)
MHRAKNSITDCKEPERSRGATNEDCGTSRPSRHVLCWLDRHIKFVVRIHSHSEQLLILQNLLLRVVITRSHEHRPNHRTRRVAKLQGGNVSYRRTKAHVEELVNSLVDRVHNHGNRGKSDECGRPRLGDVQRWCQVLANLSQHGGVRRTSDVRVVDEVAGRGNCGVYDRSRHGDGGEQLPHHRVRCGTSKRERGRSVVVDLRELELLLLRTLALVHAVKADVRDCDGVRQRHAERRQEDCERLAHLVGVSGVPKCGIAVDVDILAVGDVFILPPRVFAEFADASRRRLQGRQVSASSAPMSATSSGGSTSTRVARVIIAALQHRRVCVCVRVLCWSAG